MKARHVLLVLATLLAFQTGSASAGNVSSADIIDGEVKNVDIDANAVTTDKILDATVGTADLANEAVSNEKIAAGAVDDDKITGPISASKISSVGLDADLLDGQHASAFAPAAHNHDSVYQRKYANTVVVAQGGGDFSDPAAAMSSITDASESKPYLLKIMPGVYTVSPFAGKSFVDVEGSGPGITILRSNSVPAQALFTLASDSEIRDLSFELGCEGGYSIALLAEYGLKHLRNVRIGGDCASYGIYSWAAQLRLVDVEIHSQSHGLVLVHSSAAVEGCAVDAGVVGIELNGDSGGTIDIQDSQITAASAGLYQVAPAPLTIKILNSRLQGTASSVSFGMGTSFYGVNTQFDGGINSSYPNGPANVFRTIGCYDTNYDPLVP